MLRGDHSSRSRLTPRLKQPTRGLLSAATCAVAEGAHLLRRPRRSGCHVNANSTSRAGSPLLFGLAPRGVFRASGVATRAVGSYPTFSPLPTKRAARRRLAGLPARCHRAACRRRYIFCGTFRERTSQREPKPALPKSPPWRYQARCPLPRARSKRTRGSLMTQDGVRTFLPSSHLAMARPAITRPARQLHYNLEFSR